MSNSTATGVGPILSPSTLPSISIPTASGGGQTILPSTTLPPSTPTSLNISPSSAPSSPPIQTSTPTTDPIQTIPTTTTARPASNTNSASIAQPTTTLIRTITQGSGSSATVIVVTQTVAANDPAVTNRTTNSDSGQGGSSSNSGSTRTIAIVIPCVIVGIGILVGIIYLIKRMIARRETRRAAEEIKWPEVVSSEGDRAALYPEPTRPGTGHGLGDFDEEDRTSGQLMDSPNNGSGMGMMTGMNYAGHGAGMRNRSERPMTMDYHQNNMINDYPPSRSTPTTNNALDQSQTMASVPSSSYDPTTNFYNQYYSQQENNEPSYHDPQSQSQQQQQQQQPYSLGTDTYLDHLDKEDESWSPNKQSSLNHSSQSPVKFPSSHEDDQQQQHHHPLEFEDDGSLNEDQIDPNHRRKLVAVNPDL